MAKTRSYRRIRKRTLVVAGLTLAAALLVSGIIAVLAVLQVGPEELLILNVSRDPAALQFWAAGFPWKGRNRRTLLGTHRSNPLFFARP